MHNFLFIFLWFSQIKIGGGALITKVHLPLIITKVKAIMVSCRNGLDIWPTFFYDYEYKWIIDFCSKFGKTNYRARYPGFQVVFPVIWCWLPVLVSIRSIPSFANYPYHDIPSGDCSSGKSTLSSKIAYEAEAGVQLVGWSALLLISATIRTLCILRSR